MVYMQVLLGKSFHRPLYLIPQDLGVSWFSKLPCLNGLQEVWVKFNWESVYSSKDAVPLILADGKKHASSSNISDGVACHAGGSGQADPSESSEQQLRQQRLDSWVAQQCAKVANCGNTRSGKEAIPGEGCVLEGW